MLFKVVKFVDPSFLSVVVYVLLHFLFPSLHTPLTCTHLPIPLPQGAVYPYSLWSKLYKTNSAFVQLNISCLSFSTECLALVVLHLPWLADTFTFILCPWYFPDFPWLLLICEQGSTRTAYLLLVTQHQLSHEKSVGFCRDWKQICLWFVSICTSTPHVPQGQHDSRHVQGRGLTALVLVGPLSSPQRPILCGGRNNSKFSK